MAIDNLKILQTLAGLLVTVSGWVVAGRRQGKDRLGLVSSAAAVIALAALVPVPAKAWLYNSVPPIQGRITDATTGKPIKDVVLEVRWVKEELGPVSVVMKTLYVATDEAGVYRIPAYSSVHIFSWFSFVIWDARHPLYWKDQLGIGQEQLAELTRTGKQWENKQIELSEHPSLGASGDIIFNFSLLSLMEKPEEKLRAWAQELAAHGVAAPSSSVFVSFERYHRELAGEIAREGPSYFLGARQIGLTVDTEAVFKQWDELAARFPDDENLRASVELGKNRIVKGPLGE